MSHLRDGATRCSHSESREDVVEALAALEITNVLHRCVLLTKVMEAVSSPVLLAGPLLLAANGVSAVLLLPRESRLGHAPPWADRGYESEPRREG